MLDVDLQAAQQALAQLDRDGEWQVTRTLSRGATRRTFLLTGSCGKAVLRVSGSLADAFGLEPDREAALMQMAHAAGIAPAVIAVDAAAGLLLTQFVPGKPLTSRQIRQCLPQLGQTLAGLHALAVPADAGTFDAAEIAHGYAVHIGSQVAARVANEVAAAWRQIARDAGAPVICHGDLHAGNVIRGGDGRLAFVDWDYARAAPAGMEFAVLQCDNDLSSSEMTQLTAAYAPPGRLSPARLDDWLNMYKLLKKLWLWAEPDRCSSNRPQ